MTKRPFVEFDADAVFARIRRQPIAWSDLAGSEATSVRRRLKPILDGLLASGAVRFVKFGGRRLLAAAGWTPTPKQQLQEMYERCRRLDGCMVWSGRIDPQRGPVVYAPWGGAERSVRRRIWAIYRRKLSFSHTVAMTCENPEACVLFEHMVRVSRNVEQQGKPKTMAHRHAIAMAKRKTAKLDDAKVAVILSSEKSGRSLARDMNVSAATVQKVRARDRWRNYRATPFTGLEAANDSERRRA